MNNYIVKPYRVAIIVANSVIRKAIIIDYSHYKTLKKKPKKQK